jgi:RNA polymerase sigma-70 factor (ECF subfamily)
LLKEVARGDPDALEALYQNHRKGIMATAFAAVRDDRLAEDILQETMLYIWRHAADYRYDHNPKAWIYTIARHKAVDLLRRNKNWTSVETFENTVVPQPLTTTLDPDSEITLRIGISKLGTLEAQVFVLKAIAGFDHSEISKILGLSYRSTHYRYRCAIRDLKRLLSE